MQLEYWIFDTQWRQVTHEEYNGFNGKKEQRPSTWRMMVVNALLLPYRYMN